MERERGAEREGEREEGRGRRRGGERGEREGGGGVGGGGERTDLPQQDITVCLCRSTSAVKITPRICGMAYVRGIDVHIGNVCFLSSFLWLNTCQKGIGIKVTA